MAKKALILASAIAALAALIAPAAANATPVLTSSGVKVPIGTAITGTANNTTIRLETETSLGVVECESIMLNGEVTENSGTSIKGAGRAGSTTEGCSFEGEVEVGPKVINIVDIASDKVEGETGTGTFHTSWETQIPGGVVCKFSNVGKPAGVFHYNFGTGSGKLVITPTNVTSSGCGESFLRGEVALETPNGTPLNVS